ncbi:MAG TPA: hypothetical protein VL135_01370 [Terracidiphilus sp.]|jgi:hypothetical protein|nr:hypothetical protein [Terracidiphilus sp.]
MTARLLRSPIWAAGFAWILFVPFGLLVPLVAQPGRGLKIVDSREVKVQGGVIHVDFAEGKLDEPDAILRRIQSAAAAVTAYYGHFPVARVRVLVVPVAGRHGVVQGTTWGDMAGFPGMTRLRVGEHTTDADLRDDWTTTHELVHMGFPTLPDDQHWMEEGLATYLEPLARVMTGELTARSVWHDMVRDMHQGEPGVGDEGLDHTHSWGRTYWGGAMFCLMADVSIRQQTHNRRGMRDALRAIVDHGGTIDQNWDLPKALAIGDAATGTHVLTKQYARWKDAPVTVDLSELWAQLGVRMEEDQVSFLPNAPLANIRESIAGERLK